MFAETASISEQLPKKGGAQHVVLEQYAAQIGEMQGNAAD